MNSERAMLERQMAGVELRPFTLDRLHHRIQQKQRRRKAGAALMGLAVAAVVLTGSVWALDAGRREAVVVTDDPGAASPFVGHWTSTDGDGSTQTMRISANRSGEHEILIRDDAATVCSGVPSTLNATGQVQDARTLVLARPVLTCDDGSEPRTDSRPLRQDELLESFVHQTAEDELHDSFGVVWQRVGTAPSVPDEPAEGSPVDPPGVVRQLVDALNTRNTSTFIDLFTADGAFVPRGTFEASTSFLNSDQNLEQEPLVRAWMSIVDAWGLEAEIRSCRRGEPGPSGGFSDSVDELLTCEVRVRWHTFSLEIGENWIFQLVGGELAHWTYELDDLNPQPRQLALGYDGLEAWEAWLSRNDPDAAGRYLNPRVDPICDGCDEFVERLAPGNRRLGSRLARLWWPAEREWVIDGLKFRPFGLIPYDPASAPAIEASIRRYLDSN